MPLGSRLKVLVVEDDEGMREAIESLLDAAGIASTSYASAEALLDSGAVRSAACVITDLKLQGMSGLQLLDALKHRGPHPPLILITAHDSLAVRSEAASRGASAFLARPFHYQPQVESWDGNQINVRAAVSIKPAGAQGLSFGAVFATARTEVDRVARTVVFNDLQITKSNFPTLPDQGAAYASELKAKVGGRRTRHLAGPGGGFAEGRRREGAEFPGEERAAADHRQQHTGHPGAYRRRASDQASSTPSRPRRWCTS